MRAPVVAVACLLLIAAPAVPAQQCQPYCPPLLDAPCEPFCDLVGIIPEPVTQVLLGLCKPHC